MFIMSSMYFFVSKYCKYFLFVQLFSIRSLNMIFKMRSEGNESYVKELFTNVDWKSDKNYFILKIWYISIPVKERSIEIYVGACRLISIDTSNFCADYYRNMTGQMTLILQLTYWHFKTLFPWMRSKVDFLRTLHEMSGVHESRWSLPKHIGRKNWIAIGLVLHLESYMRIFCRYY